MSSKTLRKKKSYIFLKLIKEKGTGNEKQQKHKTINILLKTLKSRGTITNFLIRMRRG